MEKRDKLIAGIVITLILGYGIWLLINFRQADAEDLRRMMMILCTGCAVLSPLFSTPVEGPATAAPVELSEEDQTAFQQVDIGSKIMLIGGIMFVGSLIVLFCATELAGTFAGLFAICFFGGIVLFIFGAIIQAMGSAHIMKLAVKIKKEERIKLPESVEIRREISLGVFFRVTGMLALAGWIILFIFFR